MPRPLRLEFPNARYHISSRDNRRENIYDDDKDRKTFLNLLGKIVTGYNLLCYGYYLINYHYYLNIEMLDF